MTDDGKHRKARPDAPAADKAYDVGYARPPAAHRFQKGRSGNPQGRPKQSLNTGTLLQAELEKRITVTELGKQVTISKRDAFIKSLVARAIKGDARAAGQLLKAIETLEPGRQTIDVRWMDDAKPAERGRREASSSKTLFPMSEEEWLAKFGPDAHVPREPCDHERMSDDQIKRALKVVHASLERMLQDEEVEG